MFVGFVGVGCQLGRIDKTSNHQPTQSKYKHAVSRIYKSLKTTQIHTTVSRHCYGIGYARNYRNKPKAAIQFKKKKG
jgi:hypothetical protein